MFPPQGEYSGFIYSYAVEEPLSVVHKVAGYLPSLFWGFITLGRLISIPVSYRMKPATMVFINVVRLLYCTLVFLRLPPRFGVCVELRLLSRGTQGRFTARRPELYLPSPLWLGLCLQLPPVHEVVKTHNSIAPLF